MKSTSLILSAAVFCSALAAAQENYSLWPRRPAELEQAQHLIRQQKYNQALELLAPFIHKRGLTGHESRHLTGAIRVRRYLTAEHPRAHTYTVRRGENIERIAANNKSSRDLLILINGMVDPSDLKVGQKLIIIPQDLRAELQLAERELSVWDGHTLIAVYDVRPSQELLASKSGNEETQLKDREGELNGSRVPRSSALYPASDRRLRLANGISLIGSEGSPKGLSVHLKQREVNELSLLLGNGARVSIVRNAKTFDPFPSTTAEAAKPGTKANK